MERESFAIIYFHCVIVLCRVFLGYISCVLIPFFQQCIVRVGFWEIFVIKLVEERS